MGKSIAVFGLGRFGKSLALSLAEMGMDVMVADRHPEILETISDKVAYAIEADLGSAESIEGLGLENMDVLVVATGSKLETSIMSVVVAKELGVPLVIAKAYDERMGAILKKVGADKVIYPEEESGQRTAKLLFSDSFLEFFDIDSDLCILEMKTKKEWVGKNLMELDLRKKYKINVIAVKIDGKMHLVMDPERLITEDDIFLVAADPKKLKLLN